MSHEVVFLPHILGQTWAQALAAARTAAREEDPRIVAARLEPWPELVLHAAQILGQIEEFRGRGQRELVHPVTRLRFTFFGEDGVIALPYWYDGPVARMAATMAFRFAHAVESDTGLAAYDPQQRTPLAEMGLEKFVAGYLRGRERALDQVAARGAVPVGHELPTGRSASRRELSAGPSGGGRGAGRGDGREDGRRGADAGRPVDERRRGGKPARGEQPDGRGPAAVPRKGVDQRPADGGSPTSAGRLRRVEPPGRGAGAVRRDPDPRRTGQPGSAEDPGRRDADPRQAGRSVRREDAAGRPAKNTAQRPPADSGRRRGVAPEDAAGRQKPPRPRQSTDARQPPEPPQPQPSSGGWLRRGLKPARKPQRGSAPPPGSEWVQRPGSPELGGPPPDPRAKRRQPPAQGGRPEQRRAPQQQQQRSQPEQQQGSQQQPRQGSQQQGRQQQQGPQQQPRRRPPELPKG